MRTPGQAYDHTSQQQTLTNTEFEVKLKYSIPNDGKSHLVALQDKSLKADFNYLIVPKLDNDAFLIARITGWEDGGLMPVWPMSITRTAWWARQA